MRLLLLALLIPAGLLLACGDDPTQTPVSKSDPQAFTRQFVEKALDYYDENGREATIDFYNTRDSVDGEWYVFIIDDESGIIAHATRPERIGFKFDDLVDINGKNYGAEFAATTGDGSWVSYMFRNPANDDLEQKHSWVVRRNGLVFGSGWYER